MILIQSSKFWHDSVSKYHALCVKTNMPVTGYVYILIIFQHNVYPTIEPNGFKLKEKNNTASKDLFNIFIFH